MRIPFLEAISKKPLAAGLDARAVLPDVDVDEHVVGRARAHEAGGRGRGQSQDRPGAQAEDAFGGLVDRGDAAGFVQGNDGGGDVVEHGFDVAAAFGQGPVLAFQADIGLGEVLAPFFQVFGHGVEGRDQVVDFVAQAFLVIAALASGRALGVQAHAHFSPGDAAGAGDQGHDRFGELSGHAEAEPHGRQNDDQGDHAEHAVEHGQHRGAERLHAGVFLDAAFDPGQVEQYSVIQAAPGGHVALEAAAERGDAKEQVHALSRPGHRPVGRLVERAGVEAVLDFPPDAAPFLRAGHGPLV